MAKSNINNTKTRTIYYVNSKGKVIKSYTKQIKPNNNSSSNNLNNTLNYQSKNKSELKTTPVKNSNNVNKNSDYKIKKIIDPMTTKLIDKYKTEFEDDKYTIYLKEKGITYNFKITKAFTVVRYHGGSDANGYAQGQLVEDLDSNADPSKGIISDQTEVGKELIKSYVGYEFKVKVTDMSTTYTYIVLNTPKNGGD